MNGTLRCLRRGGPIFHHKMFLIKKIHRKEERDGGSVPPAGGTLQVGHRTGIRGKEQPEKFPWGKKENKKNPN